MKCLFTLLIMLFPVIVYGEEKSEKIEHYDINPRYEKLKNLIEEFEESVREKREELKQLFRPSDFAKRKQILTIIKVQKKTISEKIDRAYYAGKITNGEYFVLRLKIESIQ